MTAHVRHRGVRRAAGTAVAWLIVTAVLQPLRGHHSFAAHYFEDQLVDVSGTVTAFDYRAPHAWVHVAVTEPSGLTTSYAAEWGNPRRLERSGVAKTTLKAGDTVTVWGAPGRNAGEHRLHLKRIQRTSDGWSWGGLDRQRRRP